MVVALVLVVVAEAVEVFERVEVVEVVAFGVEVVDDVVAAPKKRLTRKKVEREGFVENTIYRAKVFQRKESLDFGK